jgi:hypothetical protein
MPSYVISLEEVLWGGLLLAVTMGIHGMGMLATLRVTDSLKERAQQFKSIVPSLGIVILGSLMIIVTSLVEISVWAEFFLMMGALSNRSSAFYYALVNYTTLDSGYLPQHWHLLEGLLAMGGLLTLAWSTGILYTLVDDFQKKDLRKRRKRSEPQGTSDTHP